MSLNAMRALFHSRGLGLIILIIVTGAMLVTAYTGIGAILTHNSAVQPAAQTNAPDSAVATVDGIAITRQEFDTAYENAKQRDQMEGQPDQGVWSAGQDRMGALQQLISQTEAVKIAENAGVSATDDDIDKARQQQLTPLIAKLGLSPTASVDQVNAALQANGAPSVDQLIPQSMLRQQAVLQKYQDMVKAQVGATDSAVQQYYRQVHVRHILIADKTRPDAQAKALAQLCIDKLKAGADFASLVTQYSDDPGTKKKGGDDGFISQTTRYVPEFLKAALALNAGQVTPQPVFSPQYGYFVIQAIAVKADLPKDYAKNQAKYQQQVAQFLQNQYMQFAMEAESNSAKIAVVDPLLKAYYDMSKQTTANSPAVAADFQKALPSADYSTKGEIYAQLAMIDLRNKDTKDEVSALQQALSSTEDAQLRLMLGDAYRKQGDTKDALIQYASASSGAYNTPDVHLQLQQDFKQMGQPKLAAGEQTWMQQYLARQKQSQARPGGVPGGMPINIPVKAAAAKPVTVKTVSVKTTAVKATPAKPTD